MSSIDHLSTGPHTVAFVSLGYGGAGIDYRCCRTTCTPYVSADDFERILRETNHLFHSNRGPEQFEGAFVLDKRLAAGSVPALSFGKILRDLRISFSDRRMSEKVFAHCCISDSRDSRS